ncbi:MAG: hypothetical protein RUMPE_00805 [Eubacteriales bacterium SKADARSKE-1]|nr:hypothetical protein [Eubacteriales bacterium SKADARSKE-1]
MKALLLSMAKGLVENPNEITVDVDDINEDGIVVYHLHVSPSDMGRVIGKQGRIAKAMRMVMRSAALKNKLKYKIAVEID